MWISQEDTSRSQETLGVSCSPRRLQEEDFSFRLSCFTLFYVIWVGLTSWENSHFLKQRTTFCECIGEIMLNKYIFHFGKSEFFSSIFHLCLSDLTLWILLGRGKGKKSAKSSPPEDLWSRLILFRRIYGLRGIRPLDPGAPWARIRSGDPGVRGWLKKCHLPTDMLPRTSLLDV